MDLSSYISFLVKADITDIAAPVWTLTDNSVYPVGVTPTGVFTVTQPDGLTRTGTFDNPDVTAVNGTKNINLRLDCNNILQQGEYAIKYEVHADGYDPTILSRSFTISYTKPTVILTNNIDVFTPSIEVEDNTVYSETGYTNTVTRSWSAVIGTFNLTGTNSASFDLKYGAYYYDAAYTINFSSIADFQSTVYSFLSIRDSFSKTDSFDVYAPESSAQLLTGLTALKTKLDSLINSCQKYDTVKADYEYAYILYTHAMKRICAGDKTGVYTYLNEITAIINNNVKPVLTHTNTAISAYVYDCGSSPTPTVPFALDVVAGQAKAIAAGIIVGATTFTNSQLASKYVLVFRGGNKQQNGDPLDGGMFYTKSYLDTTITFSAPIADGESIAIYTI